MSAVAMIAVAARLSPVRLVADATVLAVVTELAVRQR
jgi:hypothetical protein